MLKNIVSLNGEMLLYLYKELIWIVSPPSNIDIPAVKTLDNKNVLITADCHFLEPAYKSKKTGISNNLDILRTMCNASTVLALE